MEPPSPPAPLGLERIRPDPFFDLTAEALAEEGNDELADGVRNLDRGEEAGAAAEAPTALQQQIRALQTAEAAAKAEGDEERAAALKRERREVMLQAVADVLQEQEGITAEEARDRVRAIAEDVARTVDEMGEEAAPAAERPAAAVVAEAIPTVLTRDQTNELFNAFRADTGTDALTLATKISRRKGTAADPAPLDRLNSILAANGKRKISQTKGDITLRDLFKQLDSPIRRVGVETPRGEFVSLSQLI
jgi:hypothetical protein